MFSLVSTTLMVPKEKIGKLNITDSKVPTFIGEFTSHNASQPLFLIPF